MNEQQKQKLNLHLRKYGDLYLGVGLGLMAHGILAKTVFRPLTPATVPSVAGTWRLGLGQDMLEDMLANPGKVYKMHTPSGVKFEISQEIWTTS